MRSWTTGQWTILCFGFKLVCSHAEKFLCVYRLDMFGTAWVYNVIKPCWTMTWFHQVFLAESALLTCLLVIIINAKWKSLTAFKKKISQVLDNIKALLWFCERFNSTFSSLSFCSVVFIFHWALFILLLCCLRAFTLLHIAWNS